MAEGAKKTTLGNKLKQSKNLLFGTSENLPRIIEVDLAKLRPNPDQPRQTFDEEALRGLADSIVQHGLLQPVAVAKDPEREDGYIIVAGERRYRAHQLLGRDTIPAVMTSGNLDEISLIENVQREDLSPLEEAEALKKMMERHGYTQGELGKVIGKKQNTVSELLRLTALPKVVKDEYLSSSTVSKSALIELSRIEGEEEQVRFWNEVKTGGLTVRAARSKKSSKPDAQIRGDKHFRTHSLVGSGRRFVAELRDMESKAQEIDDATYGELLELHREIGKHVKKLTKKAS
ncbi:MAG: Chromosome (plasmid) partitioning protein ParB [uncultured Chloroflexia bacterium]|uniref:Chromosome (Plasmid) partitioning protein ParB n=1 Tax=uncultured Chloroflexia bacterium TaxID=1672391 RepID=A0A6J4K5V6_9CHLR|nr:MAG: Chromosome (plasmid) partitioning protein ParB [uncultured Chloroflexia bacterium]